LSSNTIGESPNSVSWVAKGQREMRGEMEEIQMRLFLLRR
jgi:hypothetical protein